MPPLVPMTRSRIVPALCAFFVAAVTLTACGGDDKSIPSDAVAVIDGNAITQEEYQHWAQITANSSSPTGDGVVPDPPSFARCVAALQRVKPPRGQPKPSATTLRAQCSQQHAQLVQQTMATLIQSEWIEAEAEDQDVDVSDDELDKRLKLTKRQSFPTERAYQQFLRRSGMSQEDVLERLRTQLLAQNLQEKIQRSAGEPSDSDIAQYYDENRAQFSLPERRDLEVILTRTEAQADAAKAAVQGGMSWAAAAKRFSTDTTSKANGGVLRGVSQGQEDRALDRAAFRATRGKLVGPVKGQFGWYIVRVRAITPPEQTELDEAKGQIRTLLTQQNQQRKLQSFTEDFQKHWTKATKCRADYVVALCSNAPKPQTTSTSGGTVATTPQGGG